MREAEAAPKSAGRDRNRDLGLLVGILALVALVMAPSAWAQPRDGVRAESAYEEGQRAAGVAPYSKSHSETSPYAVCPPPSRARVTCFSAVVPEKLAARKKSYAGGPSLEGSGERGGYSPADLASAYNLPSTGGKGLTVAITVAFDYPTAESDLAVYRNKYGLPVCGAEDGCFRKVNQLGEAGNYPGNNPGWAAEAALDLDMVSATCPECHIVLVEADDNTGEALFSAVQTAAKLGADVISDSWGGEEFSEEAEFDEFFEHPGIPVMFASGDAGYGSEYPAASPAVVAVGGTTLHKDQGSRGWRETAWSGAGSGCSQYEAKPAWQTDAGCDSRTIADVSAVADPATPVSVYDTFLYEGWLLFGGTSVATPVMAGVEALSTESERAAGAQRFWDLGSEGKLFDATEGRNGRCPGAAEYLCTGAMGYDGPTGWGSPGGARPGPPVVATNLASAVTNDEATLNGAVNPNDGGDTTYHFEYGPTSAYGSTVPAPDGSVGTGAEPVSVAEPLSSLIVDATYHFRLVAENAQGIAYGGDQVFETSRWSPQSTGEQRWAEEEFGLSCAAVDRCAAVGARFVEFEPPFGNDAPAAERWNGNDWLTDGVPALHEAGNGYASWLAGVSCVTASSCMAVGTNYEIFHGVEPHGFMPLAEAWDGSKWTAAAMPIPEDAIPNTLNGQRDLRMHGVSCISPTECVAVGAFASAWSSGSPTEIRSVIETWDGSSWSTQTAPAVPGKQVDELWGVSCVSSSSCVAVGETRPTEGSGGARPLIMRWDGTNWSVQAGPSISGGLRDVSCSAVDACMAVGSTGGLFFEGAGLAERWDGTAWSSEAPDHLMQGVSCLDSDWCVGVGYSGSFASKSVKPSIELWNGSEWRPAKAPEPADISDDYARLYDVSCVAGGCTAIGWYWSWGYHLLAEHVSLIAPAVTTDAVGALDSSTAVLNGHVNANSSKHGSSCFFEVALASDAAFSPPVKTVTCAPPDEVVIGETSKMVTATASGLAPDTEYVYRVVAEPDYGPSARGATQSFSTLPVIGNPPIVTTEPGAIAITQTTATVAGTVNPNGGSITACKVEYGLTVSYGSEAACSSLPGAGNSPVPVQGALTGLSADTTYHFRFAASNAGGTEHGSDQEFTTRIDSCATNSALCPPPPLTPERTPERDSSGACIETARAIYRKALRDARHKSGLVRVKAIRRAKQREHRALARCASARAR